MKEKKHILQFAILLFLVGVLSSYMTYYYLQPENKSLFVFVLFPIAYFSIVVLIKTIIDNWKYMLNKTIK